MLKLSHDVTWDVCPKSYDLCVKEVSIEPSTKMPWLCTACCRVPWKEWYKNCPGPGLVNTSHDSFNKNPEVVDILRVGWGYVQSMINFGDINSLQSTIVISNPMLVSMDTSSSMYCLNYLNELQNNIVTYNTVLILVDTSNSQSSHISLLV